MNLTFKINKYFLMWNVLYQASISEEIHQLKEELWNNYRREYSLLHDEKKLIMQDVDDYIPSDDTIFNIVEDDSNYKKIKNDTNRYRIFLLELIDHNKKEYLKELTNILKLPIKTDYDVFVLHPSFNILDVDDKKKTIAIAKKTSLKCKDDFLTYIVYKILKARFDNYKASEEELMSTIVELVATNELFTRVTKESKYNLGKKALYELKKQLYPYWLMYLGIAKEDMEKYMIRDNMFFDINAYEYETDLIDADIYEFIDFCLENKKIILKSKTMEDITDMEVI